MYRDCAMKAEIYNAPAGLNRGFDVVLESLKVLQENGVVTAEFVSDNNTIIQELWSGINWTIVHKLNAREIEDRDHFGKMRSNIEERRSHETIAAADVPGKTEIREV